MIRKDNDKGFMKTFVMGDIHGAYKALLQCFKRSGFERDKDRVIFLGDVCDGYPDVKQCIEEMLKVKQCDYIIGNHDLWALDWALRGEAPEIWTSQGGQNTIRSYDGGPMPQAHMEFLKNAKPWIVLEDKIFVHGGFDPNKPIETQDLYFLVWDRELLAHARLINTFDPGQQISQYKEIYLGHTPTGSSGSPKPLKLCNLWALDTGAGWEGKLTIMDVGTKEYWQSDPTPQLYGMKGR